MQISKLSRAFKSKDFGFIAALIGALGFILSLVLALLMLQPQGNPGFLVIWLAAAAVAAAFMRIHRSWSDMFERIYAMNPAQTARSVFAARKNWRGNVEDVSFRDMPRKLVSFGK